MTSTPKITGLSGFYHANIACTVSIARAIYINCVSMGMISMNESITYCIALMIMC